MKKLLFFVLVMLLFSLTSCKYISFNVCKHEWKLIETILSDDKINEESTFKCVKCDKVKVEINEIEKESYNCFILKGKELLAESLKNYYYVGEKVIIKTNILIDADILVKVNNQLLNMSSFDELFWYYEFIMPNEDVNVELCVSTIDESYVYMDDLFYWVTEINVDNVVEVRKETGRIGVKPGSLSNIVYSKNNTDIEKCLNFLYSPLIQVLPQEAKIDGGSYEKITFITLFGEYTVLLSNNILYCNGNYYLSLNEIDDFESNLQVYHSFITYDNKYKGYTFAMSLVDEFEGLDKYEFIKYEEPIDITNIIGYIETEFGMLTVHTYDVFSISDDSEHNCYQIVNGDTFESVVSHIISIYPPYEPPLYINYAAFVNLYLDNLDINSLTLDDENKINNIYELYKSLSASDKEEVTEQNLIKLNKAIKKIEELKKYQYFNIDYTKVSEIELFICGNLNILLTDKESIESFIKEINQVAYVRNYERELIDCLHNVPSYLNNYIRIDDIVLCFHNASEYFYTNDGEYDFVIGDFSFIYNYLLIKDEYLKLNLEDLELTSIEKDGKEILNLGSLNSIENKLNEITYVFKTIEYYDSYYDFSKDLKFAEYKFKFGEHLYIYYNSSLHFVIYDLSTNTAIYAYCANNMINNIVDTFVVNRRNKSLMPYFDIYFEVNNFKGEITRNEPDKCSELKWCDINKLPYDLIDFQAEAIKNWQNGIKFSVIDTDDEVTIESLKHA